MTPRRRKDIRSHCISIHVNNRREIPRCTPSSQPRWKSLEIVGVLNYIKENFDIWNSNRLTACINAKAATNIARDSKAIYSKVNSMLKAMEDFIKTGRKSTSNTIIWDDEKIFGLVKEIHRKSKELGNTYETDFNHIIENGRGDINNWLDNIYNSEDQRRVNSEIEINNILNSIHNRNREINQITPETSTSRMNNASRQFPLSTEEIEKIYNEKIQEVVQLRSRLTEMIMNANNALEESNIQTFYSVEHINEICNEKTRKINHLRNELMESVKDTNNKYENLKNFQ